MVSALPNLFHVRKWILEQSKKMNQIEKPIFARLIPIKKTQVQGI
jgi:hypothetical protein